MIYSNLGKTDIKVSKIALGSWGIGAGSVWTDQNMSEKEVSNLLAVCKDNGINYIDTAPVYGMGLSETLLGKAVKNHRNDFIIQTKCSLHWDNDSGNFHYERDGYTVRNDTSYAAIKKDVEDSLKRMGLDYIDSVIVHYVCPDMPVSETVRALNDLISEGKIRAYGISNSKPNDLKEYCNKAKENGYKSQASLVQEFFSILSPLHGREYFSVCKEFGANFQVYGVLEEGFLTGPDFLKKNFAASDIRSRIPWTQERYKEGLVKAYKAWNEIASSHSCSFATLCEAWALAQYENLNLLVGMRKEKNVLDTVKSLDINLSKDELDFMERQVKDIQVEVLDK